jgi:hypothetical protein
LSGSRHGGASGVPVKAAPGQVTSLVFFAPVKAAPGQAAALVSSALRAPPDIVIPAPDALKGA